MIIACIIIVYNELATKIGSDEKYEAESQIVKFHYSGQLIYTRMKTSYKLNIALVETVNKLKKKQNQVTN